MDLINVFSFFLMLSAMQPVIKQRLLEASRLRLLEQVERQRKSRVILLVHRQETMSVLGFPMFRYIDVDDSEQVIRAIQLTDEDVPIDLVLHTPGGLVLAALQIARAIADHKAKVTVFVPHYAMSGGTMIALAADEIVLSRHAVLGPVDPQLGKFPAASILRAITKKPPERIDDETLILADQAGGGRSRPDALRGSLDPRPSVHAARCSAARAPDQHGHAEGVHAADESLPAAGAPHHECGVSAGPQEYRRRIHFVRVGFPFA